MESFAPDKPRAQKPQLRLQLASPCGFCTGVERAIRVVELSLAKYGAPVCVRHEIIHKHAAGRHILPIGHAGHPESEMPLVFITFNVPRALAS